MENGTLYYREKLKRRRTKKVNKQMTSPLLGRFTAFCLSVALIVSPGYPTIPHIVYWDYAVRWVLAIPLAVYYGFLVWNKFLKPWLKENERKYTGKL